MTLAGDSSLLLVPCFPAPAGSALSMSSAKVIARVDSARAVDSSISVHMFVGLRNDPGGVSGWRSVAGTPPNVWAAGSAASLDGVRYVNTSAAVYSSTVVFGAGFNDLRSVNYMTSQLFVASNASGFQGVIEVGAAGSVPTSSTTGALMPGGTFTIANAYALVAASGTSKVSAEPARDDVVAIKRVLLSTVRAANLPRAYASV